MKTRIQNLFIALAMLLAFQQTNAAVTFTVAPSATSNTYTGNITLQIAGLTSGDTVVVQKYLDANTNGVVDTGDLLWQRFQLSDGTNSVFHDGATAVTNFNVPGDTDGAVNGSIASKLYPSQDFAQQIVGKYLFVLSSPAGHFSPLTNSFSVTNFPFAQSITGNVVSNALPLSNAVVILFQPGSDNSLNPRGGTVANNSGAYTIKAPTGTYLLVAFKSNFVANLNVSPSFTLGANATIATNVPLTNATQSISGRVVDAGNTSIGLPGLLLPLPKPPTIFLAFAFTDTNGNFTERVVTNKWKVGGDDQALAVIGYLTPDKSTVNTSTGSVSGVTIALTKATAVFYGTVKDNLGNPLAGISMGADDNVSNGGQYQYNNGGAYTYTNGNYVLGVLGGDELGIYINSVDQLGIYTNYIFTEAPSLQNGGTNFNNGQAIHQNFTGILAENELYHRFRL